MPFSHLLCFCPFPSPDSLYRLVRSDVHILTVTNINSTTLTNTAIKPSKKSEMDEQIVVYPYNTTVLINMKEHITEAHTLADSHKRVPRHLTKNNIHHMISGKMNLWLKNHNCCLGKSTDILWYKYSVLKSSEGLTAVFVKAVELMFLTVNI